MNAPNLLEIEQSKRSNLTRNLLFLFVCVAMVGAYGVQQFGGVEGVVAQVDVKIPVADKKSEKTGGDVVIEIQEKKIVVPVQVTTSTFDSSSFSAQKFLVKDVETGKTLLSKDEYEPHAIASITKLMSALVLQEQGLRTTGTTTAANGEVFDTFLQSHFVYDVHDVWNAALIGSSNRAILSLVDELGIGRDVFVAKMNEKANELGMSTARFMDPTGLDAGNVATASDVLMLLGEALNNEEMYSTLAKTEYAFATVEGEHSRDIYNTNWLLLGWIPNTFSVVHPGKTGYIPESLYNFTTRVENEAGNALDVVVLGTASHEARFEEARDLAEWIFDNYEWHTKIIQVPVNRADAALN